MAQGRIKRLRSVTLIEEKQAIVSELSICALCDREIPPALRDAHHLIPKSKGGVVTVLMHRACHKQIHALFTDSEIARFISWVIKKPNDLNLQTRRSRNKRSV